MCFFLILCTNSDSYTFNLSFYFLINNVDFITILYIIYITAAKKIIIYKFKCSNSISCIMPNKAHNIFKKYYYILCKLVSVSYFTWFKKIRKPDIFKTDRPTLLLYLSETKVECLKWNRRSRNTNRILQIWNLCMVHKI